MSDFDDDENVQDEYESDFIDDDDDDDDDDEYTDKKTSKRSKLKNTKSKKKSKKPRLSGRDFIQAEAEEDSGEDEEYDNEMPKEERKLLERQQKIYNEQLKRRTQGPGFYNLEGDELEDYLNQTAQMNEAGEDNELALLPTAADPKLFAIRCKPREERDACNQVMKKYFDCLNTAAEFQIFSATAIDKTEGYIYIEAFSDKHVYMAIADIPNIFGSKIILVHFADRTQIFETDPTKNVQVKAGQWVRIKKGLYEGDLAQVDEVDEVKSKVLVKLVPRLTAENEDEQQPEEEEKKDRYSHLRKNKVGVNGLRPPQKLFQENEHRNVTNSRDPEKGISFHVHQHNRYFEGLLYKWFPYKNVTTQDIKVTYEESKFFTIGENTDTAILNTLIEQAGSKATKFFKGDKIRVIKGDLMNLEAEIIKIGPASLTVRPVNTEFMEALDIAPTDCVKSFVKGDYVRVVEGKNAGKEGFILLVEDNVASIMSDGLQNMIQVFVNDLVFCNESTRNIDVKTTKDKTTEQEFVKFDLVKLNDRKTVGIVMGTASNGWRILDNFGVVRNVTTYQVEQKLNTRNNLTRNDKNQTFRTADSVRILQGKYKGQTGTVKHIYSDLLFIYNPDVTQNMGIIIEKSNNAFLLSSQKEEKGKAAGPKVKDSLIGQKCAIKTGPWKGYQGIVKDGNEKTVRLELTSKCQIIDVKRELVIPISEIGKANPAADGRTNEPKTPMISRFPQSPMFGVNSPGFESSPAWNGFESPAYDSHIS